MSNIYNTMIQERIAELVPFMTGDEMMSVAHFEELDDYESIRPILRQVELRHRDCSLDVTGKQIYDTEHNITLEVF